MEGSNMQFVMSILAVTLIVSMAVYFLIKKYFDTQYALKVFENQQKFSGQSMPLKLQAYERLIMLIERISIPQLISRLGTKNMRSEELVNALMIAVNQEYDFNINQQLYISDNLWKIISLTKDEVLAFVHKSTADIDPNAPALVASNALIKAYNNWNGNPLDTARQAIKNEASLILPK